MNVGFDCVGVSIVYFCHDGQGKFVMAHRSQNARDEQNCWDIGGGKLEFDDTVEDTLRKEIREEYGADVLNYEFLGFRDVHRTNGGKPTHWVALDFKVQVDPNKVKIGEPHKFDRIDWFTLDALPDRMHSELPRIFKLYREKLT